MAEVIDRLRAELDALIVARECFPVWTEWGIEDESIAMHSVGLSYFITVGQRLGYIAVAEYPVSGHLIRADGVWWARSSRAPVAYFEFERLKDGSELRAKARNLIKAWHEATIKPELLGLVSWAGTFYPQGGSVMKGLWEDAERGFQDGSGRVYKAIPNGVLHVFECLHTSTADGRLVLKRFTEQLRT